MTIRERVVAEGTPLIDEAGATFVWLGERAPRLIGDWNNWGWEDGTRVGQALTESEPGV